jgi:hypothetical protein
VAVVSSGEIKLRGDVNLEINGNTTDTNVSLATLSVGAGFDAPHALTEFYGYQDAVAPSVSTNASTSVTSSSMTANGNVTSDGGGTITERGFYFGTSSNYANNTKYAVSGTTGSFARGFSGLSSQTTYYATAYAINSVGETRGVTRSAATTYNYQLRSIFINGYQDTSKSYNVGSYYQALNGSFVLHSTQYSSNGFLRTGLNGRGYLVGSRIRPNRMVYTVSSATCSTYHPEIYFNWFNGLINSSYRFGSLSQTSTKCAGSVNWVSSTGYMLLYQYYGSTGNYVSGNYSITAG